MIPQEVKSLFGYGKLCWMATADALAIPNVAPMRQVWWVGEECLVIGDMFMKATRPCPRIKSFCEFLQTKHGLEVVVGTHPIPEKYYQTHTQLGTWDAPHWLALLQATLTDKETRLAYD
jgi:hypothetical protein